MTDAITRIEEASPDLEWVTLSMLEAKTLAAGAKQYRSLLSENNLLAGLLIDCDELLQTLEPERVGNLRMTLAYALAPYKRERAEQELREAALDRMAKFGAWCARELRSNIGSDLDGGDAQESMEHFGILKHVDVKEACCEDCACAGYGDFPQQCLRWSDEAKAELAHIDRLAALDRMADNARELGLDYDTKV